MDINETGHLQLIENELKKLFPVTHKSYEILIKSMQYSLSAGGKRIRPVLCLEFCRLCCKDPRPAVNFALALELVHTFSLIHDDLPCMDDADMRRGKPSNHKVFGEATALLAGDAMLAYAFELCASEPEGTSLPDKAIVQGVMSLARAIGYGGMAGGQIMDMECEGKSVPIETIEEMEALKTGALIRVSAKLGCIAGGADAKQMSAAIKYAECIGTAFQIVDDLLDATGDPEVLGKNTGGDEKNEKSTYVKGLGIIGARNKAFELTKNAVKSLDAFSDAGFLISLAQQLLRREN